MWIKVIRCLFSFLFLMGNLILAHFSASVKESVFFGWKELRRWEEKRREEKRREGWILIMSCKSFKWKESVRFYIVFFKAKIIMVLFMHDFISSSCFLITCMLWRAREKDREKETKREREREGDSSDSMTIQKRVSNTKINA